MPRIDSRIPISSGGGGVPSLADPSSFADAFKLYRSDAGITLTNGKWSSWACQGTQGNAAVATSSTYYQEQVMNKGKYDFSDMFITNGASFMCGIGANTDSELTMQTVFAPYAYLNPAVQYMTWGNQNDNHIRIDVGIDAGQYLIRVIIKDGGATSYNNYLISAAVGSPFPAYPVLKLTVVFDGNEAVATDRVKLYHEKTLLTKYSTGGTNPTTVNNGYNQYQVLSSTTARKSTGFVGYQAVWKRKLTSDEISDNVDWMNEIWN